MVLKKKSLKVTKKAPTRISKAAVAHTKKAASALKLRKRGTNMSRKQIMVLQRDKYHDKQVKKLDKEVAEKEKISKGFQHAMNKRVHKPFDHAELRAVHDGLVAGIEALGEPVTPSALLMVAMTTLGKWQDKKQAPYLLVICAACFPKVSPGLLHRMFPQLLRLCEQCLSESEQNSLLTAKAMKLIQQVFSCLEPTMQLYHAVRKLEPNRLNTVVMPMYITTLRKVLQNAALTEGRAAFFLDALPDFVSLCLTSFTDAPQNVVAASFGELNTLFANAISPQIVESQQGHSVLNGIISDKLTQMFKPHTQRHWSLAAELVGTLFERLCYLKRTPNANKFLAWFNTVPFLLKVLNKIRHVDDTSLNSPIEKAMVAIGKGMAVESFVSTLPFNPMDIDKIRVSGQDEDALWKNSYLVNIVRRIAAHDSLPFFVHHFGPIIEFCRVHEKEAIAANREAEAMQWGALHSQYWRVCVGFFHYPIHVTSDSYREVAKQLVSLLSTNLIDVAANAFHVLCSGYHKLASTEQDLDDESDSDYEEEAGSFAPHRQSNKTNLEDDDTFLRMNDEGWNIHAYHGISQAAAKEVCAILAKYSTNIMPRLCNVFKTHDSSAVLNGIQSYSRVCTASVMQTILKSILDVGETLGDESTNNDQVASHRRVVLDIACAICAQLSVEHLHKVFETIVEPVLSDPSPTSRILQKKAYKLLFAMFEHRIKDMYPLFSRVMGLLAVGQQHVTVSGLKMRIRCVSWALDACKMYYPDSIVPAIKSAVGEIVLFARERSSGARDMAMEVVDKMQRYMVAAGAPHNALLHMILAGLSGRTGMLVSCTIVCLAKLVYMSFEHLSHGDLEGTVSMCFQLMESSIPEIRTAAATFARMVLKLMKRSVPVANAVRGALPKILMAIALVTSQTRVSSSVRVMMRVLLEKCIKRFGYDAVDSLFPLGSKRFLQYTNKMLRREEKKEEREMKKRAEAQKNEFSDLFLGAMKANGGGEDGDLLEGGALTQFVATRSALPFNGTRGAVDDDDAEDDMCLVVESDKIRILSKAEKKREDEYRKKKMLADRLLRRAGGVMNPRQMATSDEHQEKRKRGRDDADDSAAQDMENEELVLRYGDKINETSVNAAASKFNRGRVEGETSAGLKSKAPSSHSVKLRDQKQQRKELAKERVQEDIRLGDEFSSGKGQGDIRRGSLDPFAYVPLNRRFMNKRHRRQAVQRFEAVSTKTFKGNKAKMVYGK